MALTPALQRLLLAVAGLLVAAGAASAIVWTGSSHSRDGISGTTHTTSSTATTAPSTTTSSSAGSPPVTSRPAAPPATGPAVPPSPAPSASQGTTSTTAPLPAPHLANTGLSQVMTLLATFAVLAGVAIVWLEERTRLLRQLRLRPSGPGRSRRRGYQPRHSRSRR